jgi:hypothetical protein
VSGAFDAAAYSALAGGLAMPVPALTNVRLIAILAASLLAGYAGDELLNAWWDAADRSRTAESLATAQAAPVELAQAEAMPPS